MGDPARVVGPGQVHLLIFCQIRTTTRRSTGRRPTVAGGTTPTVGVTGDGRGVVLGRVTVMPHKLTLPSQTTTSPQRLLTRFMLRSALAPPPTHSSSSCHCWRVCCSSLSSSFLFSYSDTAKRNARGGSSSSSSAPSHYPAEKAPSWDRLSTVRPCPLWWSPRWAQEAVPCHQDDLYIPGGGVWPLE